MIGANMLFSFERKVAVYKPSKRVQQRIGNRDVGQTLREGGLAYSQEREIRSGVSLQTWVLLADSPEKFLAVKIVGGRYGLSEEYEDALRKRRKIMVR